MNDILNELDFMLKIKDKFKAVENEIGEVYDLLIERALAKQAEIKKFEERVNEEYEYEPVSNNEMQRVEQFGEVVKEIIGI